MPSNKGLRTALRMLTSGLLALVVVYLVVCVTAWLTQYRLLYKPRQIHPDEAESYAVRYQLQFWPRADDPTQQLGPTLAKEYGLAWVGADWPGKDARATVVVVHGNAGWAGERLVFINALSPRGYRVLLYEYPGYGPRFGEPRQARIARELGSVIRQLEINGLGPVYLLGESLGAGAAAAALGADPLLPVAGVVLLTPWDSLTGVAQAHYPFLPVRWLVREPYDTVAALRKFGKPVCIAVAGRDEVVPEALGRSLFEQLAGPKKLITFPEATHSTWPADPGASWWDEAMGFVAGGTKAGAK